MESSIRNTAALLMHESPVLIPTIDLMIKSTVALAIFLILVRIAGDRMSGRSRHLLYLNGFVCLAILPWLPRLATALSSTSPQVNAIFELTVTPGAEAAISGTAWNPLLMTLYLIPATVLLCRLGVGLWHLRQLRRLSVLTDNPLLLTQVAEARKSVGLTRAAHVRISKSVDSPLSFGWLSPQVILPHQAESWAPGILEDVLLHELSHIRRLDWLSLMFAYVIACVYWMNPLVWWMLKKLNEESENACDAAVVQTGRSTTDYAQSLLSVARACAHHKRASRLLTQTILDRSTLETRITQLLEKQTMKTIDLKRELKITLAALLLLTATLLAGLSSTRIVSAQAIEEDTLRPLSTPDAEYPAIAADEGIEGWVQVMFTITESGLVDVSTATVVDAEPSEIFDASALTALSEFRFSPRIRNGQGVAVPNVQYVFRYTLD